MVNVYDSLESTILKEFDVVDRNPAINRVLDYSLHNSDDVTDYDSWERGTEQFINDNRNMLRAWDAMDNEG